MVSLVGRGGGGGEKGGGKKSAKLSGSSARGGILKGIGIIHEGDREMKRHGFRYVSTRRRWPTD